MSGRDLPGIDGNLVERVDHRRDPEATPLAEVLVDPVGSHGDGALDTRRRAAGSAREMHEELHRGQQSRLVGARIFGRRSGGGHRVERLRLGDVRLARACS